MQTKRTHIIISDQLVSEIDNLVGKRSRSGFLADAAWREVKRLRMLSSLEESSGSWKSKDHPELSKGSASFVRKLRAESDRRISKVSLH
jgi:metal-responsive CopG/Arc/MetJ family transcriptional regulator